jgi:hypothetical protein
MKKHIIVIASLAAAAAALPAFGGALSDHPAVIVAKRQGESGYDYASKFYLHPARLELRAAAPRETGEHPAVLIARAKSDARFDWTGKFIAHPARLELGLHAPGETYDGPALVLTNRLKHAAGE